MIEFDPRKDDLDLVVEAVEADTDVIVIERNGTALIVIDGQPTVTLHPVDLVFALAYLWALSIGKRSNPMTVTIELTRGYSAIVDAEDADLAEVNWYALPRHGHVYGASQIRINDRQTTRYLHRVILQRKTGRVLERHQFCDHINRDSLDNTRANLRVASNSQNLMNRKSARKDGLYKGVVKNGRFFSAQISVAGEYHYLGSYETHELAGIAYNHAARRLFGEYAYFNDIPNWEEITPVSRRDAIDPDGVPLAIYHRVTGKWNAQLRVSSTRKISLRYHATEAEAYQVACDYLQQIKAQKES